MLVTASFSTSTPLLGLLYCELRQGHSFWSYDEGVYELAWALLSSVFFALRILLTSHLRSQLLQYLASYHYRISFQH